MKFPVLKANEYLPSKLEIQTYVKDYLCDENVSLAEKFVFIKCIEELVKQIKTEINNDSLAKHILERSGGCTTLNVLGYEVKIKTEDSRYTLGRYAYSDNVTKQQLKINTLSDKLAIENEKLKQMKYREINDGTAKEMDKSEPAFTVSVTIPKK